MKILSLMIAISPFLFPRQGVSQSPPADRLGKVTVLVLLGEWFGDAYFPLKDEIAARGWVMKRVGVDAEYRGGGPPPGDGFESAPVREICDAIARELGRSPAR